MHEFVLAQISNNINNQSSLAVPWIDILLFVAKGRRFGAVIAVIRNNQTTNAEMGKVHPCYLSLQ